MKRLFRGIFGQIDARDVIAVIGLSLLSAGLYQIYWPAALIAPGAILCWYALVALRYPNTPTTRHSDGHTE